MKDQTRTVVDFTEPLEERQWTVVNDGVMGGLSRSRIELTSARTAVFRGVLSLENSGGFASVRRAQTDNYFAGCTGVVLRVKGDGRTYQFRLRTSEQFDGMAYRAEFRTQPDTWLTVRLPFSSFEPTFRGRIVPDAPPLRPENIQQLGFLIADKQAGAFQIEIDWIRTYALTTDASLEKGR
jgi:monofunctional biosynthetic peptidoglycan transglycosylase